MEYLQNGEIVLLAMPSSGVSMRNDLTEVATERTAVVTGAAGRIGQAIVAHLLAAGHRVVLIDLRKPDLAPFIHADARLMAVAADVRDEASLQAAAAEVTKYFGDVHILVANAGIASSGGIRDTSLTDWKSVLDVNLTGAFNTMKAFLPAMARAAGHRSVVVTSSVLATRGARNMTAYGASKAGLIGLVKAAAQEFGSYRITVNALAPGPIRTPLLEQIAGDTLTELEKMVPVGRLGTPEDVANAALFLCGDGASFINGQLLVIDGGLNGRAYWRDT